MQLIVQQNRVVPQSNVYSNFFLFRPFRPFRRGSGLSVNSIDRCTGKLRWCWTIRYICSLHLPPNNYFASSIIINLIVIGTSINIAASITTIIRTYCMSYLTSNSAVDFIIVNRRLSKHGHHRIRRCLSLMNTASHLKHLLDIAMSLKRHIRLRVVVSSIPSRLIYHPPISANDLDRVP